MNSYETAIIPGREDAMGPLPDRHTFEPLLDDVEAAELLGIHPKTLQRWARAGKVPAHRVGKFWRYRRSDLDKWLAAHQNDAANPPA